MDTKHSENTHKYLWKLRQWHQWRLLFLILLAGSILVRILGTFNDFWLDEIWSLRIVQLVSFPWQLLSRPFNHTNSHILNSLYFYFIGDQANWIVYRLLSLVSGSAAIAFLSIFLYRINSLLGITLLWLTGFSYIFVLYSSEARGYAPALFCSVFALWWVLIGHNNKNSALGIFQFNVMMILGILSHLTFIYVYAGLIAWMILDTWLHRKDIDLRQHLFTWISLHGLPLVFLIGLYFSFIEGMIVGGGPIYSLSSILLKMVGLTLGGPIEGWGALLLTISVLSILLWEIFCLLRQGNSLWIFFLTTLLLAPAAVLIIQDTEYIYIRYFFICIPFGLFLLGKFLSRIYCNSHYGKWMYILLVISFLVGNGWRIADLLEHGRGQYYLALQEMAEQTQGKLVTISGDHDFRTRTVLDFYASYLPANKSYLYIHSQAWTQQMPEWAILQTLDRQEAVPSQIKVATLGRVCHFGKSYWTTADAESGSNWHVYHCQTTPSPF